MFAFLIFFSLIINYCETPGLSSHFHLNELMREQYSWEDSLSGSYQTSLTLGISEISLGFIIITNKCILNETACTIVAQLFYPNFELFKQADIDQSFSTDLCSSIIEISTGGYLVTWFSKSSGNKIILYRISSDLTIIERQFYQNLNSLIKYGGKTFEVANNFYRTYFNLYDTNFNCTFVHFLDINIDTFQIRGTPSQSEPVCNVNFNPSCYQPGEIMFAGKIGDHYYQSGSLYNRTGGYLIQYQSDWSIKYYFNLIKGSLFSIITLVDSTKFSASYFQWAGTGVGLFQYFSFLVEDPGNFLTLISQTSVQANNLDLQSSLFWEILSRGTSTFYLEVKSNPLSSIDNIELTFNSDNSFGNRYGNYLMIFPDPSSEFYLFLNNQINDFIVPIDPFQRKFLNSYQPLKAYITDKSSFGIKYYMTFENFAHNKDFFSLFDYNSQIYLCIQGNLTHILLRSINKLNYALNFDKAYDLNKFIISISTIFDNNQRFIIFGTYLNDSYKFSNFVFEIDKDLNSLYNEIPDIEEVKILTAINMTIAFAIGGSKYNNTISECFYAQFSFDYNLVSNRIISIPNSQGCQITSILYIDSNTMLGVGQTQNQSGGLILDLINNHYKQVYLGHEVNLVSLIQIRANFFLSYGYITNGLNSKSYFVAFKSSLDYFNDLIDDRFSISKIFTVNKINEVILLFSGLCNMLSCYGILSFEEKMMLFDYNLITSNDGKSISSSLFSTLRISNLSYVSIGSSLQVNKTYSMEFANLKISPSCDTNFALNSTSLKCIESCENEVIQEESICLEKYENTCIQCSKIIRDYCIQDKFRSSYCFNFYKSTFFIPNPSIVFKKRNDKKEERILRQVKIKGKHLQSIEEKGIIKSNFSQPFTYYEMPIRITVIDKNGNDIALLPPSIYIIIDQDLIINNVTFSSKNSLTNVVLKVNLSYLKAKNYIGESLLKEHFFVNSQNNNTNSIAIQLANSIGSLIINNKMPIAYSIASIGIVSGLLGNFSFLAIVSFAEIIQFLCLFSLLSVIKFPNILNPLFNSQNIWNINFISFPEFSFLNCSELSTNDNLDFNYNNHPSISGINFICNSFSVGLTVFIPILIYSASSILLFYFCRKLQKSYNWNGFIQIINTSFNVFIVFAFIQFQVVPFEINSINLASYALAGAVTICFVAFLVFSITYQLFLMNFKLSIKRHEKLFGSLNESLDSKNYSYLTTTLRHIRVFLSVIFIFLFKFKPQIQAISFLLFSLIILGWIIIKRPFDNFALNLKEILIETFILFTHISFIGITFYEDNENYRLYLDLIAFFSMLSCIVIDIIFMIISALVNFILLIYQIVTSRNKLLVIKKKFLVYKKYIKNKRNTHRRVTTKGKLKFQRIKEVKSSDKNLKKNEESKVNNDSNQKRLIILVKSPNSINQNAPNNSFIVTQDMELESQKEDLPNINEKKIKLPFSIENKMSPGVEEGSQMTEKEKIYLNQNKRNQVKVNFEMSEIQKNTINNQKVIPNYKANRDFYLIEGFKVNNQISEFNFSSKLPIKKQETNCPKKLWEPNFYSHNNSNIINKDNSNLINNSNLSQINYEKDLKSISPKFLNSEMKSMIKDSKQAVNNEFYDNYKMNLFNSFLANPSIEYQFSETPRFSQQNV